MTSNQIQKQKNERENVLESEKLNEAKRHNRASEGLKRAEVITKGVTGLIGSGSKYIGSKNDPSWYNLNKQLVSDVASISFTSPLGISSQLPRKDDINLTETEAVSGIMAMGWIPVVGGSNTLTDASAINVSAKALYSFVRFANSGARNYDAPDLMMYLYAVDSAYIYYSGLLKMYAALTKGNAHNWYWPRTLVQSLGGNYDSLSNNIANLRAYINSYSQRLAALNVPGNLPLFARHLWLASNFFKDTNINKSQIYHFVPEYVYTLNENEGKLDPVAIFTPGTANKDLNYFVNIGNTLINNLLASEDIGIMSGDILKAYGENAMMKVSSIDANFTIDPVYSDEVLSQINSATLLGDLFDVNDLIINQTNDGFIYQGFKLENLNENVVRFTQATLATTDPNINLVSTPNVQHCVINFQKDSPTPDDVMVATRLTASCYATTAVKTVFDQENDDENQANTVSYVIYPRYCGSEVLTKAWVHTINKQKVDVFTMQSNNNYSQGDLLTGIQQILINMGKYNQFDWAPAIHANLIQKDEANDFEIIKGYSSLDLANHAVLTPGNLEAIHSVALQSEYGVPLLGNHLRKR